MTPGRSRLWLLLCALMMRALVPTGFMLGGAIGTSPALIACDGKRAVFATTPAMHHGEHHDDKRGAPGNGDCPLSAAGAIDTPIPVAFVIPVEKPLDESRPVADIRPFRPAAAAAPPPSTGPPFIA